MPAVDLIGCRLFPVADIDVRDRTYAIAPAWFPLGPLAEVVARYGVFSPICIEITETSSYRVLSGFRRLQAAIAVGLGSVPAVVYQGEGVQLFRQALAEEASTRPLHLLEKAFAAWKLINEFRITQPEVTREFLPLLGVKANHFELRRLLEIADMPSSLQKRMLMEGLQPEVALSVARWEASEQAAFLTLFDETKPGFNHQKELWCLLDELRARDGQPIDLLIQKVREEAGSPSGSSAQLQGILAGLRAARFPRLSEQNTRYRELRAGLRLPPGVQFQIPPFFEGCRIDLTFSFASPAELKETADRLAAVAEKPELEEILGLL
jgi:ParB/RepB/Spo0J family partition protein